MHVQVRRQVQQLKGSQQAACARMGSSPSAAVAGRAVVAATCADIAASSSAIHDQT